MAASGISAASPSASSQQVQSLGEHKHKGRHGPSITDVGAAGANAAAAKSTSGKIGNRVNITA